MTTTSTGGIMTSGRRKRSSRCRRSCVQRPCWCAGRTWAWCPAVCTPSCIALASLERYPGAKQADFVSTNALSCVNAVQGLEFSACRVRRGRNLETRPRIPTLQSPPQAAMTLAPRAPGTRRTQTAATASTTKCSNGCAQQSRV